MICKRLSLLPAVLALAPLAAAQTSAPPTAPLQVFVEVPGELEFTGVMNARPLQLTDAEKYGMSEEEIVARREAAQAALTAFELVEYVDATDETLFRVPAGSENQVAAALMADGNFQYVEPDWRVYPIGCPNDSKFNSQWHHNANRMNSCNGWDIWTGDPDTVVAICDTGIRTTHQEFQLHRKEGYNAVNQQWENSGGQINDINGHGTATTGCAAANGNNGVGISGTGWDLGHRMMRVSNSGSGSSSISTLTHAARTAADVGDKVASVSYSGVTSSGVNTTGAYVRSKGALLVWAAGNSGQNLSGNRDDNVIIVGATTSSDTKSGFSNYGSRVDLMAPGSNVFTTSNSGNASYGSVSGTSFSCPLAAGLCALIFSADPSLTPQEVEDILRAGCDDLGANGVDNIYGYGRIDVFNSLSLVDACPSPANYCVTSPNSVGTGAEMNFLGSNTIADDDATLLVNFSVPNQFGVFFYGPGTDQTPVANGFLCISGGFYRFPAQKAGVFGSASHKIDFNNLPVGGDMAPGETWFFQWWNRDPNVGAGSNFSDGLEVTWCN